jgi:DNA processing protein
MAGVIAGREAGESRTAAVTELDEDRLAWLALTVSPGLGPRRIHEAMRRLRSAGEIFSLSLTEIEGMRFPAEAAQFVFEGKARAAAEKEWGGCLEQGVNLVTFGCEAYPERLKEIYDPPPVLWVRGDAGLLKRASIAIVGTRHPTPYGTGVAEMLGRDLAARGMLVVSGMARGIDTYAHKGALAAGRPTVAVWGTGADVIYPKENKRLAEEILAGGGAIVSELQLGTFPAPQNFPRRNRILSGVSLGVVVVEASENSGTRVTARCAADQGRDVFAVPGNVTNKNSWTPNTLIKQGALLTATWEDVWEALPSQVRIELESGWVSRHLGSGAGSGSESNLELGASLLPDGLGLEATGSATGLVRRVESLPRGREAIVLNVLRQDVALQMDEILDLVEAQLSSSEVFTALFELELAGRIRSLPGKNFVRMF